MTTTEVQEQTDRQLNASARPASRAWLGTRTWPAYCVAGITAAYGALKAYWVFGGTALWEIAPLPQDLIEKAKSHTAADWFVIADAATVVLLAVAARGAHGPARPIGGPR
jgi:hypothetical protein